MRNPVLRQNPFKLLFLSRLDVIANQVTVSGQPDRQLQLLGDFAKSASKRRFFGVLDSSLFDPNSIKKLTVALLVPTQKVSHRIPFHRFGRFETKGQPRTYFVSEPFNPALFEQIFQPGALAVGTISKISLGGHYCFSYLDDS